MSSNGEFYLLIVITILWVLISGLFSFYAVLIKKYSSNDNVKWLNVTTVIVSLCIGISYGFEAFQIYQGTPEEISYPFPFNHTVRMIFLLFVVATISANLYELNKGDWSDASDGEKSFFKGSNIVLIIISCLLLALNFKTTYRIIRYTPTYIAKTNAEEELELAKIESEKTEALFKQNLQSRENLKRIARTPINDNSSSEVASQPSSQPSQSSSSQSSSSQSSSSQPEKSGPNVFQKMYASAKNKVNNFRKPSPPPEPPSIPLVELKKK
jgi:uncharacterized membrane protein HdeD (DUF308 family)